MTNPARPEQVYAIFEQAHRCDPARRAGLLDELCVDDAELRAAVERLLAADEQASQQGFLAPPNPPNGNTERDRRYPLGLRGLEVHVLCPHCRNPIGLVNFPITDDEVVCPSCGSTFQLERESTGPESPRMGQRWLGRFELIEKAGFGAFGTVYKARDPQLDRTVAIKVPRVGSVATEEDRNRFLREGRSVAQLQHEFIVPVHEVGEHDGVPYLISDFVQGISLSDSLTGRRPSAKEAARLIAELADALHYAHERGVIHRDVKPSNIMLDDKGKPRLMDFGLAKRDVGEITMTIEGQVLGTPAYMSPEQARGQGHMVDGRSDVYSLAVILYEILTGELPFRGNQRMVLHQVLNDEPKAPRKLNDRIRRDLETICLKAMAKEPVRDRGRTGRGPEALLE